jgi:hypothetical protein
MASRPVWTGKAAEKWITSSGFDEKNASGAEALADWVAAMYGLKPVSFNQQVFSEAS